MATNSDVVHAWRNSRPAKSGNGNLSTNGNELYSYNMVIGKTFHWCKLVLDVSGVWAYSVTTSNHVSEASYGNATIRVIPKAKRQGYSIWYEFPANHETYTVIADSRSWKTQRGAENNVAKVNAWLQYRYPNQVISVYAAQSYNSWIIKADCRIDYELLVRRAKYSVENRLAIYEFAEAASKEGEIWQDNLDVLYEVNEIDLLDALEVLRKLDTRAKKWNYANTCLDEWKGEYSYIK